MKKSYLNYGQALFEMVTAIGIAAAMMVAIVALVSRSLNSTGYAENQTVASSLNTQAVEWLRNEKTDNWRNFANHASTAPGSTWCLNILSWATPGLCPGNITGTIYKREVVLESDIAQSLVSSTVKITWTDDKGNHEVRTLTYFTHWR